MKKQKNKYLKPKMSICLIDFHYICNVQVGSSEFKPGMDIDSKKRQDCVSTDLFQEDEHFLEDVSENPYGSLW